MNLQNLIPESILLATTLGWHICIRESFCGCKVPSTCKEFLAVVEKIRNTHKIWTLQGLEDVTEAVSQDVFWRLANKGQSLYIRTGVHDSPSCSSDSQWGVYWFLPPCLWPRHSFGWTTSFLCNLHAHSNSASRFGSGFTSPWSLSGPLHPTTSPGDNALECKVLGFSFSTYKPCNPEQVI